MILIDGIKYLCLECVRGHRSSLCRHHTRPLLQVRSKGRPNVVLSSGNKNHRIAVFAEEIASSPEPEGLDCKKLPVIILKASDKHIIDLSSGQIVGPYNEEEQKNQISKPVIRAESFVNSTPCCSQGVSKVRKLCTCNHKRVSKSKILSTYIKKLHLNDLGLNKSEMGQGKSDTVPIKTEFELDKVRTETELNLTQKGSCCLKKEKRDTQEASLCCSGRNTSGISTKDEPQGLCCSEKPKNEANIKLGVPETQFIPQFFDLQDTTQNFPFMDTLTSGMLTSESGKEVFEVINVPSCSIPGSCCCSSDCQCPNCEVHNNAPPASNLQYLNSDSQFGTNLILTSKDGSLQFQNTLAHNIANPLDRGINSVTPGDHKHPFQNSSLQNPLQNSHHGAFQNQVLSSLLNSHQGSLQNLYIQKDPLNNGTYQQQLQEHLLKDGSFRNNESLGFIQQLLNSNTTPQSDSSTPDQPETCTCPDDACFCQNCEAHGIIEGYKLDDIFVSKLPLDLINKM
ncbi:CIC11C00000003893 [Sungouiella intermedia]|uniref:CIC11C00000003893 n=1 Tax=Sungouiella intermedia TaxID=45354 RepID=A0A1L0GFR2_9ASCO|nr:CIC11C00000003893 [[Candida] intermedia]